MLRGGRAGPSRRGGAARKGRQGAGRAGRAGLAAVAAAWLAAVSGCSGAQPCAGYGVVSAVVVTVDRTGYGDLTGASFELCARGECSRGGLRRERVTRVSLPLPRDADPGPGPVRFRVVREGAARPVIDTSADVALVFQPDGCGGGAYSRALALTGEGGLTTKIPKSVTDAWRKQLRSEDTADPAPPPSP
ncbi:hypothetical protein [Streptomyces sp. NPDC006193]|uniref:hypothetical protein n=1 Tax=Streptomyces sp. NPDC006193 TaxID=3155717 RepID=UPI0033AA8342